MATWIDLQAVDSCESKCSRLTAWSVLNIVEKDLYAPNPNVQIAGFSTIRLVLNSSEMSFHEMVGTLRGWGELTVARVCESARLPRLASKSVSGCQGPSKCVISSSQLVPRSGRPLQTFPSVDLQLVWLGPCLLRQLLMAARAACCNCCVHGRPEAMCVDLATSSR